MRLNYLIAHSGICSRRQADVWISQGRIRVNGKLITAMGQKINPQLDIVTVDGQLLSQSVDNITYAVNKPLGYVSTTSDELHRPLVTLLVPTDARVFPVGRLDKDSEGLLILTNDGDLSLKLTHPQNHVPKTYQVLVNRKLTFNQLMKVRNGLKLKHIKLKPAGIDFLKETDLGWWYQITLRQGKNRQIRRMMQALNCQVIRLIRTQIGQVHLKELQQNQYIILNSDQLHRLSQSTLIT